MSEIEHKLGLMCPSCNCRKEWKADKTKPAVLIEGENKTAKVVTYPGHMTERCYFHNKKAQGLFNTEELYNQRRIERLEKMRKERTL